MCLRFHRGEVFSRRARVQSQVERSEPEDNLDGFLAVCTIRVKTKAKVSATAPSTDDLQLGGMRYEKLEVITEI